jgi:hypothetical protein
MNPFVSFHDNAFNKNLVCPQGIRCNPCPEDFEGSVLFKDIISRPFNYVKQNDYLKILIGCVW